MANATARVAKKFVSLHDGQYFRRSVETLSAETTYYVHALIGIDTTGYYCKGDDTQSWILGGIVRADQGNQVLPAGTAGDTALELEVHRPEFMQIALSSVAVTDIGKTVYADDDQTAIIASSSTTYGNVVGFVYDLVYDSSGTVVSNIALVKLSYDGIAGHARLGATKVMAATGTQTLTKYDLNKVILLPNTAAHTLNLPAIAGCPAGTWMQFMKTTSDAAAVTLDGDGSETIDGATTYAAIDAQYDCARLVSDGSGWIIAARDIT